MKQQEITLPVLAEELLVVLERDVEHVEWSIMKLNELRGFVIKRDEKGLAGLLEDIKAESLEYSANEQKRLDIRRQIAGVLDCPTEAITVSVLKARVDEQIKTQFSDSQMKLKNLLEHLRREYITTAALLADCSRINSLLLKAVFERGRVNLVCYDSAGATARGNEAAFMSMHI
jgi:hypothetical protein